MRQNGEQASELLGEVHRFRPDRLGHHITGRGREGRALEFSLHLRCLRAWSRLVCPVSISLSHEQNATLRCQGTLQRESRPCRLLGVGC